MAIIENLPEHAQDEHRFNNNIPEAFKSILLMIKIMKMNKTDGFPDISFF